nr:nucleoside hydrolase [Spelaeicoccus albus]
MDVDTGIDDSLALLYLLGDSRAQLEAIVCTAGNVPARQVADNTLGWLALAGAGAIEVALGAEVPLSQPLQTTEDTHGPLGVGYAELPPHGRTISGRHAASVWSEAARSHPGEVTGLVTGPLTNLALAVQLDPELPQLLGRLVVMGGALNHPGNTRPTVEWNTAVDPDAAKIVFDRFAGLPAERRPILCPLDLTERIVMTSAHVERLAAASGCAAPERILPSDDRGRRSSADVELIRQLSDAIRFYMEFHRDMGQGFIAHMHDPFAAAVALDPGRAQYRPATLDVELAGRLTRGQIVADWPGPSGAGIWGRPPNADVAADTDPEAFFDALIERIAAVALDGPAR